MAGFDTDCSDELECIIASKLPDLEKLAQAFDCITSFEIFHAQAEIELARALQDGDQVVKMQVKRATMAHARSVFAQCYLRISGRRPWHAEE